MLRSLGSSLVAKSSPGSRSRDVVENRLNGPTVPDKGDPGSVSRQLTQETKIAPVAPGSEKVLRVSPGVSAVRGMDDPGMGILGPESAGLIGGAAQAPTGPRQNYNPAALRSGANNQPLLSQSAVPGAPSQPGAPTVASAAPRSGKTATAVSSAGSGAGENLLAGIMGTGNVDSGPRQNYQVQKPTGPDVLVGDYKFQPLGGRVQAAGEQGGTKTISGNTAQAVAGTLSKAAEKIGGGSLPQIGLRSFAQNVNQVTNPLVSPAAALQSLNQNAAPKIVSAVGSAASNLRSQASNVLSKLRSLFK